MDDETGLGKYVAYEENKIIAKFGEQNKDNEIAFIEYLDEENEVFIDFIIIILNLAIHEAGFFNTK